MIIRVDLRGYEMATPLRRERALEELADVTDAFSSDHLDVLADGDTAFAARLVVPAGVRVGARPTSRIPKLAYRPFGEFNRAPRDADVLLVEVCGLGNLVSGEEGPDFAQSAAWCAALAADDRVVWRIGCPWQGDVLRRWLKVPKARIWSLPARARLPSRRRSTGFGLPPGLPSAYQLCLTPLGENGDFATLIAAHAASRKTGPMLAILGVEDVAWRPTLSALVARAGSKGRVCLLRDVDPISSVAAIAQAGSVVAIDHHPVHAIRLRQAALLGRPAVLRRHPGHAHWVGGGRWFDDDPEDLAHALRKPVPVRAIRDARISCASGALVDCLGEVVPATR